MTSAKNRAAGLDERIMSAARKLAQAKPLDHIGLSEVARLSGVSWPTVKRYVGSKEELRSRLAREEPELVRSVRDTKTRLMDAAARVFASRGYERATLDEVASVAGLTKGAVYWHFESKGDLLRALLREHDRREIEFSALELERIRASESFEQAAYDFVHGEIQRIREAPEWMRLITEFMAAARDESIRTELAEVMKRRRLALATSLRALQELAGREPDAEPDTAARIWSAIVRGVTECQLVQPELELEPVALEATRLLASWLRYPGVQYSMRVESAG